VASIAERAKDVRLAESLGLIAIAEALGRKRHHQSRCQASLLSAPIKRGLVFVTKP